jgi:glycosyltransferase involved in cell wall biosynthesis
VPKVSVVIPTYNRSELLARSLDSFLHQRTTDEFEIVVSDDGSSDRTAEVVRSFDGRLPLIYNHQEHNGYRAAATRNAGARRASGEVLAFVDTGTLAGPDFVTAHSRVHGTPTRYAVIGDTWGYRPHDPAPGLYEAITDPTVTPAQLKERFQHEPRFADWRTDELAPLDYDITRRTVPWLLHWSTNISMRTADFWAVGGFDEDFQSWGTEDLELGYRLYRLGAQLRFDRDAWAIEAPHERNRAKEIPSNQRNALKFLCKHRDPAVELTWATYQRDLIWEIETGHQALLDWSTECRSMDVRDELDAIAAQLPPGTTRVAILGCGDTIPASLPSGALVMDFDRELLDKATADGRHEGYHGIGLRTPLADQSVDATIVTSRINGLWDEWWHELLTEANRIGRRTYGPKMAEG